MTHLRLSTDTEIKVWGGKSEFIVDFRLFRGSRVANEDKIKAAIQAGLDTVVAIADLEYGEPGRPARRHSRPYSATGCSQRTKPLSR